MVWLQVTKQQLGMVRQRRDELSCLLGEAERSLEAARQQQAREGEAASRKAASLQGQLEQCKAELQVRQPPDSQPASHELEAPTPSEELLRGYGQRS